MWRVTYHALAWFLLPAGALRLAVLPSVENAHATWMHSTIVRRV